ncbi:MAG: ABC transporter ATP-binding protein [Phycisphaeraceae bacterium]|nr:ABC transporter ATP-binding protein [Phycisphaeraceae bacterium]
MSELSPASLICRSLSRKFGEQVVLDHVDFELEHGTTMAFLGPSGCGKSTLLNIVAGLLPAHGGRVTLGARTLDDPSTGTFLPAHRRDFAMVFQDFSLWPHLTVQDNVGYGLKVRGIDRRERGRRIAEALEQVEMMPYAHRYPAQLSGGQQQRVAIARAIVVRPRLLLMDEPLSALDARLRDELRDALAVLLARTRTTTLYVTHDQAEAFALARTVAVMNRGRIEQLDTPQALYQSPRTPFVASFIGASQLLRIERRDDRWCVADGCSIPDSWLDQVPAASRGWGLVRRDTTRIEPAHEGAAERLATGGSDASGVTSGGASEIASGGGGTSGGGGGEGLPAMARGSRFLGTGYETRAELSPGVELRGMSRSAIEPDQPVRVVVGKGNMRWIEEDEA